MKENTFQKELVNDIKKRLPDAIVLKNDPSFKNGIVDLTILHNDRWATLECKKSADATHRPNQDTYVDIMNKMSYSAFVYPENKEKILNELEQSLKSRRRSRTSKSE